MKTLVLYSAVYSGGHPFDSLPFISKVVQVDSPEKMTESGILVVWGGGDISPSLYNKKKNSRTWASHIPSDRDRVEMALMQAAVEKGMPIIGVCRGAQMLCAVAGGTLIQHVNNHSGRHHVQLKGGGFVMTNSIHHQMMNPFSVEHELRAWIAKDQALSDIYVDEDEDVFVDMPCEPEYVYFPKIKGFAIQWHPEAMPLSAEANKFLLKDITCSLHLQAH